MNWCLNFLAFPFKYKIRLFLVWFTCGRGDKYCDFNFCLSHLSTKQLELQCCHLFPSQSSNASCSILQKTSWSWQSSCLFSLVVNTVLFMKWPYYLNKPKYTHCWPSYGVWPSSTMGHKIGRKMRTSGEEY